MAEAGSHDSAQQEPDDPCAPPEHWTAATFLQRANQLRDHTLRWHIDDGHPPIEAVSFLDAESYKRRTFRGCFTGDHGLRPNDATVFASSRRLDAKGAVTGVNFVEPDRLTNRVLTLWLLRDYWQHLQEGESSELRTYLKLAFERVIDELAFDVRPSRNEVEDAFLKQLASRRPDDPPVGIVTGRPVRPELVDDVVGAAEKYLDAEALPTSPSAVSSSHGGGEETNRKEILASLQSAERKAYVSYELVESHSGKRLKDRQAYDLLVEEGLPAIAGDLGEMADYEPPEFDTWSRQLRSARNRLGDQKYLPRAGRRSGPSVVPHDQI